MCVSLTVSVSITSKPWLRQKWVVKLQNHWSTLCRNFNVKVTLHTSITLFAPHPLNGTGHITLGLLFDEKRPQICAWSFDNNLKFFIHPKINNLSRSLGLFVKFRSSPFKKKKHYLVILVVTHRPMRRPPSLPCRSSCHSFPLPSPKPTHALKTTFPWCKIREVHRVFLHVL